MLSIIPSLCQQLRQLLHARALRQIIPKTTGAFLHKSLEELGTLAGVTLPDQQLIPEVKATLLWMTGVLSVKDDLCVITTCRCRDRWNYANTIKRMLDKFLHLRW